MANVANTIATGPASKDTVSGGKKFPLKPAPGQPGLGSRAKLGTSSDEAHRKIMGLKMNPGHFDRGGAEATFTKYHAPTGKA